MGKRQGLRTEALSRNKDGWSIARTVYLRILALEDGRIRLYEGNRN